MIYRFKTSDLVCSQMIEIELDDQGGKVTRLEFAGGCQGNLAGICRLAVGMTPDEVIEKLSGICCGRKPTSCPDQLATALKEICSRR